MKNYEQNSCDCIFFRGILRELLIEMPKNKHRPCTTRGHKKNEIEPSCCLGLFCFRNYFHFGLNMELLRFGL